MASPKSPSPTTRSSIAAQKQTLRRKNHKVSSDTHIKPQNKPKSKNQIHPTHTLGSKHGKVNKICPLSV